MRLLSGLWCFFWGKLFSLFIYDKKYLKGRWFTGRFGGMFAPGWRWVTMDGFARFFLGHNKTARFPVSSRCTVICPENIHFHPDNIDNFQSVGIYYQAFGDITIGEGSYIGPNVGIITANHKLDNLDAHDDPKPVIIGKNCWIGMNSVILPGVVLGDNTIVGAGSVVTKSFMGGGIIVGSPAKLLHTIGDK
ncbi:MAG: DapH/DapD/GlmU-related protein [Parabacteroides sp.]|nr:DapH/DapD/GlmU-related protein [Parabacteroides sp.]